MPQQPASPTEQLVQFRKRDAERINNAVIAFESSRRGRNPSSLPRATGGGGGGGVEEVRFLGAWPKGFEKTVFVGATTATTKVTNWFCNIGPADAVRRGVAASLAGDEEEIKVLVNAEC